MQKPADKGAFASGKQGERSMFLALGLLVQAAPAPPYPGKALVPISPQDWITQDDYPLSALRWEREGSVGFTLDISADGDVTRCLVTDSSGWPDLDTTTCDLLRARARFVPALDQNRRPISARYSSRIRWNIPDVVKSSAASWATWGRVEIDVSGKQLTCTETVFGPVPELGSKCDEMGIDARRFVRPGDASVALTFGVIHRIEGAAMPAGFSEPKDRNELARSVFAYDIDPDGSVRKCHQVSGSSTQGWDGAECPVFNAYLPGSGPAGVAAPYHVTVTLFVLTSGERVAISDLPSAADRK